MITSELRTTKELYDTFLNAFDSSDGHYFDSDECWYCGFRDGVMAAILYTLKYCDMRVKNHRIRSTATEQMCSDLALLLRKAHD